MLVFCLLALYGFGYYRASDDGHSLNQARLFAEQVPFAERILQKVYSIRIVPWLSTWVINLLGPSVYWSSVIAAFLFGFATITVVAFLWRREYPQKIPIIAAIVLVTNPLFLRFSTSLYPEVFMSMFMVLAVVQYQMCSDRERGLSPYFFVGMLIGFATLSKETGVLLFPILAIHRVLTVFRQGYLKACIWSVLGIGLGGLLVYLLSVVFMAWWFHRPWLLFELQGEMGALFTNDPWYKDNVGDYLRYLKILVSRDFTGVGLLFLAAAVVTLFGRGGPKLEAITGLGYFGYLLFGSASFIQYIRPTQHPRYLIPCLIFFAMCFAYQSSRLLEAWERYWSKRNHRYIWARHLGWMTLCLFFVLSALNASDKINTITPIQSQLNMIRETIRDVRSPAFVTSGFKSGYRPVLSEEEFRALHTLSQEDTLPERYTILLAWNDFLSPPVREISWQYATVTLGPLNRRSWVRNLVDIVRKRPQAWYERNSGRSLYRIDVDTTGPKHSKVSTLPWEREK